VSDDKPKRANHQELPTFSYAEFDRAPQIKGILVALESGQFYNAALLCDAMLRDDRVSGVMMTRLNGLLGTPLEFEPAKDTALGNKIAAAAKKAWPKMFPASASSELHRWGLLLGLGVGQLVWSLDDNEQWLPRLKTWHPSACWYDFGEAAYWINTIAGAQLLPRTDDMMHGDGNWVVYTPFGFVAARLRGLARSLVNPYLIRQWTYRDWARFSEVHGLPIRALEVPFDAEKKSKDSTLTALANIGSETVLELPSTESGKFGLSLIEAKSTSFEGFGKLLAAVESSISTTVLGHSNATDSGGGGVYGPKVAETVRADLRRFDAETLAGTLHEQALYWWAKYNYGDGALAPKPVYQTAPEQADATAATALQSLALAVKTFRDAGAPIDMRRTLEKFGVPMTDEDPAPLVPATPAPSKE
jgi:hypothetical protein